MHEYDISLKLLLRGSSGGVLRALTGAEVTKWLDVEMPEVRNTRVDLLGETSTGELIHIELQSTNDPAMALRMLEYGARVFRLFGRLPRQIVLYVGEAQLRMNDELAGHGWKFRYELVDIRELDGELLLESRETGDNVIAVLARLRDQQSGVRRILERIADGQPSTRDSALRQLLTLAGLRRLAEFVEQEVKKMPLLDDIMEHPVIGRERKLGMQLGRHEGELTILKRQIERRFGAIPAPVHDKLEKKNEAELIEISDRLFDAQSLEDLMQ